MARLADDVRLGIGTPNGLEEDEVAALKASIVTEHGGHRVLLRLDGTRLETPPVEHLAFYAGLGVLVGAGVVELPVAVALTIGHLLIDATTRPRLQALGMALEEA